MAAGSSTHSRSSGPPLMTSMASLSMLVLVGEVAPQVVVGIEAADGLERQRLQPPGAEGGVVVGGALGDDLHAVAELADVLVEGGLEPAVAQRAAAQPVRRQRPHLGDDARARRCPGAPNSSSGRVVPRPSESVAPSSITVPA